MPGVSTDEITSGNPINRRAFAGDSPSTDAFRPTLFGPQPRVGEPT